MSFGRASGKRPDPSACDRRPTGRSLNGDEDVTATEATKADCGALGLKLVTIGELDAHREERELIGSEAVEDIGAAGECSEQKSWNCRLAESGTSMCRILKAQLAWRRESGGSSSSPAYCQSSLIWARARLVRKVHKESLDDSSI